ncbi:MAG: CRISPR-associated protein Csx16 [Proteobacteria bacterium]|nr:CRISPR-associated protein Csx16 [Pseudomonadota bacterium]
MTHYFITRHPGAKAWAEAEGITVDQFVVDFDPASTLPGDIVMGSLPVNLAAEVSARGGRYFHLCLPLAHEWRGRELSVEDMRRFGSRLEEFQVLTVKPLV